MISVEGFALPVRKLRGNTHEAEKATDAINFSKKKLGQLSALIIAALVRSNLTLMQLNLSGNAIGVAGAVAVAEATAFNTTLQQVDIRNNKLDADAKAAVRSVAPLQVAGRLLVSTPDSDNGDERTNKAAGGAKIAKSKTAGSALVGGAVGNGAGPGSAKLQSAASVGKKTVRSQAVFPRQKD